MRVIIYFLLGSLFSNLSQCQIYTGCQFRKLVRKPDDCSKFLQCSNGFEYEMPCPPGLLFNENPQNCDWEANVADCRNIKTTTKSTQPGFYPMPRTH